jgi:CRISPR-associated Csx2 family protein
MAKKFISFLGTNNYIETRYKLGDYISKPVRFVQEALIGLHCDNWSESDSIIIFCTKDSYAKNWVDNGQELATTDIEKVGLESRLSQLGQKAKISEQEIPEGFTESAMWNIFNSVYNSLDDKDEIYLDVTHAFRSIPLFTIPLFNFAKFMKKTKLAAIYYGAFESLGPISKAKNIPVGQRIAPIVELSSLIKLQATNVAASNFIDFGKVGSINIAMDDCDNNKSAIEAVNEVKSQLTSLDYYILTCNMDKLRDGEYYRIINNRIDEVCTLPNVREAEKKLLRKILESLSDFGFKLEPSDHNIVGAAQWAAKHNMIQQAYTIGEEYMIYRIADYITDEYNDIVCEKTRADKDAIKGFVSSVLSVKPNQKFEITLFKKRFTNGDIERLTKYYNSDLCNDAKIQSIKANYNKIRETRNLLNHANGYGNDNRPADQAMASLRDKFKSNFEHFLKVFPPID